MLRRMLTAKNPDLFNVIKPTASRTAHFPFLQAVAAQAASDSNPALIPRPLSHSHKISYLPFSTDPDLREAYRGFFGDIRLGKVLEDLDAFAGGVAYSHSDGFSHDRPLTIVTASVDKISLKERPPLDKDLRYSGGVEYVGRSSMNVLINVAYQKNPNDWVPVLESRFTMVARDRHNQNAAVVNPLVPNGESEEKAYLAARDIFLAKKAEMAREREREKSPPSKEDLEEVHRLFKEFAPKEPLHGNALEMKDTTMASTLLMHPQNRNIHGKVFGGYLMRSAFEQAFSCLYLFSGAPPLFKSVDDISFLAPVDIGSILQFQSQVVYTRQPYAMVETTATVIDPRTKSSKVTNVFRFTFDSRTSKQVVPRSYEEALSYVKGSRLLDYPAKSKL